MPKATIEVPGHTGQKLQDSAAQQTSGAAEPGASATSPQAPVSSHRFKDISIVKPEAVLTGISDPGQAASVALSGASSPLPHLDSLQPAFGGHDLSGIKAHTGKEAARGATALSARAFAQGEQVAFSGPPTRHEAAHEAAHVVQQRAGSLAGSESARESHANQVADAAAAGHSAVPLLAQYAGMSSTGSTAGASGQPVQRLALGPLAIDSHERVGGDALGQVIVGLLARGFDTKDLTSEQIARMLHHLNRGEIKGSPQNTEELTAALNLRAQQLGVVPSGPQAPTAHDPPPQVAPTPEAPPPAPSAQPIDMPRGVAPPNVTDEVKAKAELSLVGKTLATIEREGIQTPGFLFALAGMGGRDLIDAVVRADRVSGLKRRDFVARALSEIYGLKLEAKDWKGKALTQAWEAFRMVPMNHVVGTVAGMERKPGAGASFTNDRNVAMGANFSHRKTMGDLGKGMLKSKNVYSDKMRPHNAFKAVALHEVGHGVDGRLNIMTQNQAAPDCGGWVVFKDVAEALWAMLELLPVSAGVPQTSQLLVTQEQLLATEQGKVDAQQAVYSEKLSAENEEIKAVGAPMSGSSENARRHNERRLFRISAIRQKHKSAANKDELEKLAKGRDAIAGVVKGEKDRLKIEAHGVNVAGFQQLLKGQIPAKNLSPNTDKLIEMVQSGKPGWNQQSAEIKTQSDRFGGRMFHASKYDDQWVSYLADKRLKEGVTKYQWRAPAEWFAELYSAFYLGALEDPQHPRLGWIRNIIKPLADKNQS